MGKHTPGPWKMHSGGPYIVTDEENPKVILCGAQSNSSLNFAAEVASIEDYENRKIASYAPEMINMLLLTSIEIGVLLENVHIKMNPMVAEKLSEIQSRIVPVVMKARG